MKNATNRDILFGEKCNSVHFFRRREKPADLFIQLLGLYHKKKSFSFPLYILFKLQVFVHTFSLLFLFLTENSPLTWAKLLFFAPRTVQMYSFCGFLCTSYPKKSCIFLLFSSTENLFLQRKNSKIFFGFFPLFSVGFLWYTCRKGRICRKNFLFIKWNFFSLCVVFIPERDSLRHVTDRPFHRGIPYLWKRDDVKWKKTKLRVRKTLLRVW